MFNNIFERVKERGIQYNNWQTDLYIPVNDETKALIEQYEFRRNITTFVSNIDHKLWYDIPFAYTPGWNTSPVATTPAAKSPKP